MLYVPPNSISDMLHNLCGEHNSGPECEQSQRHNVVDQMMYVPTLTAVRAPASSSLARLEASTIRLWVLACRMAVLGRVEDVLVGEVGGEAAAGSIAATSTPCIVDRESATTRMGVDGSLGPGLIRDRRSDEEPRDIPAWYGKSITPWIGEGTRKANQKQNLCHLESVIPFDV